MGQDNQVHMPDDPSAPIFRSHSLDNNGIFNATSNTGNQSVVIGIDPVKLYQWIFGTPKSNFDPLERYKLDPDY
jgi:hypothetical protein